MNEAVTWRRRSHFKGAARHFQQGIVQIAQKELSVKHV